MKRFLVIILAAGVLYSCGDAGFQQNIGKTVDFPVDVAGTDLRINVDVGGVTADFDNPVDVNLGSDAFANFELDEVEITAVTMSIVGYDGEATMDLTLAADAGIGFIRTINDIQLSGGQTVTVEVHPGAEQSAIDAMGNAIVSGSDFVLTPTCRFSADDIADIDQNGFEIIFDFTVVGKIRIEL